MKLLSYADLRPEKGIVYSRVHLWRMVRDGRFPVPVKIGANRSAWVEDEIDRWIEQRVAERDAEAA